MDDRSRFEKICKLAAEPVYTLYSVQELSAWEYLQKHGSLRGDGRRVDKFWKFPYQWLNQEMVRRVDGYRSKYPVWAWLYPSPNARWHLFAARGTPLVRIKFRVPREKVLLSDYAAWHYVLYLNPIFETEKQSDQWFESEESDTPYDSLLPHEKEAMSKSWEKVFDLAFLHNSPMHTPLTHIQATLGELRKSDIIDYHFFTAR